MERVLAPKSSPPPEPPRKIGYARVSTEDQKLHLQIDALKREGCQIIFKDHGVSGQKDRRPGLDALLEHVRPGDTVVVWKLDRLGRSLRHLASLGHYFQTEGIQLKSISDAIDTSTPGGMFYFHVLCALAEFERNLISERTKEGMRAAKERGQIIGRPRTRRKS